MTQASTLPTQGIDSRKLRQIYLQEFLVLKDFGQLLLSFFMSPLFKALLNLDIMEKA